MPDKIARIPIFMGTAPDYEVRGDNMHIVWGDLEFVLPVPVMLAAMGKARREVEKWHARTATVVSIDRKARRA